MVIRLARKILILAALFSFEVAAAEEPEAAARKLLEQGSILFQQGQLLRAHTAFAAARALVPERANPYRWLGLVEAQLGRCAEAISNIEQFVKRAPAGDPRLAEIEAARSLCEKQLATKLSLAAPAIPGSESAPPPALSTSAPTLQEKPRSKRSVANKWWFWTAIAGGTAALVTAVTLGVVLGGSSAPPTLSPVHVN